jgi:tetratricopeptide (TPR) repeat protein
MKKNLLLLYLTILCLFSFNNYAQKAKEVSKETQKKDNYAYIDAVKTYERVSDKGYKSPEMLKKMGNAYFFNEELDKAAKCYGELCEMTTDLDPEYYYRYSIVLKAIGENEKASENLKKFNQLSGNQTK